MESKQTLLFGVIAAVILGLSFLAYQAVGYLGFFQESTVTTTPQILQTDSQANERNPNQTFPSDFRLEVVADDLFVPWSLAFTSADRMLVTERSGQIRVIQDNQLQESPLYSFEEVNGTSSEEGLMSLVLDPNYQENLLFYVCLAYQTDDGYLNKVVQLKDEDSSARVVQTVIDQLPSARFHAGCELGFGPDEKLYITTGDAIDKNIAQDLDSLGGKLLRLNTDGSIPDDNPFPGSAVWSYGHRNAQGIAWHPSTNLLFSSEHGPSLFDGPAGGDEINRIDKGANYGWPLVSHEQTSPDTVSPLLVFTPAIAPGSTVFYSETQLLVAMLKGEGILNIEFSAPDFTQPVSYQKIPGIDVGRIREITLGPDGLVYFSTSNTDGRGELRANDDKIYRVVPN